jgi:uncharacterized integral membrane protein
LLRLLGILVLLLLGGIWAVQNGSPVRIRVFLWAIPRVPLSVLLLVAALVGALAAFLALLPQLLRLTRATGHGRQELPSADSPDHRPR